MIHRPTLTIISESEYFIEFLFTSSYYEAISLIYCNGEVSKSLYTAVSNSIEVKDHYLLINVIDVFMHASFRKAKNYCLVCLGAIHHFVIEID